jgi:spermidine synthase
VVYLLFFLSGAAGLIYEISWSRQIGLLFGHTVNAAAVVLAAYFCGMALGYWHAGRRAPLLRRPLLGYGAAELIVALWALATPLLLGLLRHPAVAGFVNSDSATLQTLARIALSFIILLPATAALGATTPFIAQHVSPPHRPRPSRIALAYGFNTFGAVAGVLAASFALLLYIGVTGSSYLAAGISALCGLAAIWIALRQPVGAEHMLGPHSIANYEGSAAAATQWAHLNEGYRESPVDAAAQRAEHVLGPYGIGPLPTWALYALAALSGCGILTLQVLYTRLFALLLHNSTYTFGSIVGVFLVALAAGSWATALLARRYPPRQIIGWGCALGALAVPSSVLLLEHFTRLRYINPGAGGFTGYMLDVIGMIALTVGPATFALGLTLPALWLEARNLGSAGAVVGRLASFAILPLLGLWYGFAFVALLYLAAAMLLDRPRLGRLTGLAWACIPLAVIGCTVLLGRIEPRFEHRNIKRGYQFLFNRDTPYGIIEVLERNGERYLRQNRAYTLGGTGGAESELLQGRLPLALHPAPRRVCYLGLATGITAGAALDHPGVEQVTSVELIPDVVAAARQFRAWNNGVVPGTDGTPADPRSRVVVNDARHFLYATPEEFDVICSDLFVPWHSQTGYLYTVEHYRACRADLAPGGIFCQWLPLYQLGARELELIADSFAAVFPHTAVVIEDSDAETALLALLGSEEALAVEWDSALRNAGGRYLGRWPRRAGVQLNTDEHPRVEFLAPISQRERRLLHGSLLQDYLPTMPVEP